MSEGLFYAILATSQTKHMARYTAQVWVSGEHPYDAEINAVNVFQARKNIARREGVDESDVNRVFEIRNDDSSSSSSGGGIFSGGGSSDTSGYLALGMVVLGLWLIIEFWWIVIPVAVLGGIGWFLKD